MSRAFDMVNLPSEGKFYSCGTKSLNIRNISGIEEKVLSSYFLNESGEGLRMVLENLILDDFSIVNLILSDLQGIMIYLYATAFGDELKMQIKCPHCGYSDDDVRIRLSGLNFKKQELTPQDNKFKFYLPYENSFDKIAKEYIESEDKRYVEILIKPPTFGEQIIMKKSGLDTNNSTNKIVLSIDSIGGNNNKNQLAQFIKSLNLKTFKKIKTTIQKNELGVDDKQKYECDMCNQESEFNLNLGYDFLKLPETHKQNVLEECFLISHYNQGGMNFDRAMELPTTERRWMINRIQEEMQKKKEAEEKAYNAAKNKKK